MGSKNNKPSIRFIGFNDNWEQRKLVDEVELYSGLTYSPNDIVKDNGTLVLRSSNVKNGEVIDADNVYVNSEVVNSDNVKEGDIIIVVRNGSRSLIGKHGQIKVKMDNTVIGAFMTGMRSINSNFINALLDTPTFYKEIEMNLGATINQITNGMFHNMYFMFPNDEEQKQIGTFFKHLDNLISLHQRKLDNLEILKKTFLDKLFPKNNKTIPLFRFSGFNDDWEQMKLKNVLREKNIQHPQNEEYPLVSFTAELGVTPKTERYEREQLVVGKKNHKNYKATQFNDIVYNPANLKFGAISRNTYGNAVFSPIYTTFLVNLNYLSEFVEMYVTRKNFINFALKYQQGTVYERQAVHPNDFLKLDIKLPCISEQTCLAELYKEINDIITLHQIKVEHLENLKKYFLNNMFI